MFSGIQLDGKVFPKSSLNKTGFLQCGHINETMTFSSEDNFLQIIHSLAQVPEALAKLQLKFLPDDQSMNLRIKRQDLLIFQVCRVNFCINRKQNK